jgi:CheY-like chemotaxis protein
MSASRILVVEDDAIIAMHLESTLERLGYVPLGPMASGEDALEQVAALQPDLVLMDIGLAGKLDGIATGARLREQFDLPVVYLTAHSDADTIARARATLPVGYLTKPFQETSLLTTVEIALQTQEVMRRLRASESAARAAAARETALERQLLLAQKTESLRVMAGGVAHNFNNLLMVVLVSLEQLGTQADSEAAGLVNDARRAAERAAQISGFLLSYLGQNRPNRQARSVGRELRELLPLLQIGIPGEVGIKLDEGMDDPWVTVDAAELRQVVVNLVTNAWEAIETKRGFIRISLRKIERDAQDTAVELGEPRGRGTWACLEITDEGVGMDTVTRQRMFDPFFTTKFPGRGLGLCVALGIVRANGGTIEVQSAPSQGTVARVLLPLSAPAERAAQLEAETPSTPRVRAPRAGAVLVVDDEPPVLKVTRRVLERRGHQVLTATTGPEALALLAAREKDIGCVLLDLSMQGMDGWQILSAIRLSQPDTFVIVATGYDLAQVRTEHHAERPDGWLQKPYTTVDLDAVLPRPNLQ